MAAPYMGGGPRDLSCSREEKGRLFMESQHWGSRRQAMQKMARIQTWKGKAARRIRHSHRWELPDGSGSSSGSSSVMKF